MTDLILPPALRSAKSSFRYVDQTGITRGVFSGTAQTTSYGGDRVACSLDFTPHGGKTTSEKSLRAQLQAFIMSLRGRQNRVYIADDSNARRGSFPATELFTNSDFSNGTTGWTVDFGTLAASDGVMRLTASQGGGSNTQFRQDVTVTQYAPYVMRTIIIDGAQSAGLSIGVSLTLASVSANDYSTTRGYRLASGVVFSAGSLTQFPCGFSSTTGFTAGAYVSVPFTSLSRCALADGGGSTLLQSDTFQTTWTPTNCTVATNTAVAAAPDGTTTADVIVEAGATNVQHSVNQSYAITAPAQDVTFSISLHANARTWAAVMLTESVASHTAYAFINLSTGALGTTTVGGANWTNVRSHVVAQGNGWYRVTVTARKASAATTITSSVFPATADNAFSYAGSATTQSVFMWRACSGPGSLPTRGAQTTTVAVAAESQAGSGIYVKGLPASTSGLLLIGDWVEIDGQLKMVTASLDADAAGLGYLLFSPPLSRAVADNTPIIIQRPMGRFMLSGDSGGWANDPGLFSSASIEFEEAALA